MGFSSRSGVAPGHFFSHDADAQRGSDVGFRFFRTPAPEAASFVLELGFSLRSGMGAGTLFQPRRGPSVAGTRLTCRLLVLQQAPRSARILFRHHPLFLSVLLMRGFWILCMGPALLILAHFHIKYIIRRFMVIFWGNFINILWIKGSPAYWPGSPPHLDYRLITSNVLMFEPLPLRSNFRK